MHNTNNTKGGPRLNARARDLGLTLLRQRQDRSPGPYLPVPAPLLFYRPSPPSRRTSSCTTRPYSPASRTPTTWTCSYSEPEYTTEHLLHAPDHSLSQADAAVAPNVVVYNAAIRACATPDHWPIALSLLDDARADGLRLTRNSFNCALAACEAGAQWEEALLLVEGVQAETGSRPDEISFHTAIAACRRAVVAAAAATRRGKDTGREADVKRARREGRRAARAALGLLVRMRASRVRTSLIGYTTAMSALSTAGYVRGALCVYGLLAAAYPPDVKSVGTALAACEKAARWAQGLRLLEGLRGSGAAGAAVAAEHAEWADRAKRRLGEGAALEGARHGGSDGADGGVGRVVAAVVGGKRRAAADGDGASSAGHVKRTAGRARAKQRATAGEVESA